MRILRGFEREVYLTRFAPDGKRLVTSGGDGVVRIWNLASGSEERRLSAPGDNWDARAAFSPSGKFLATGHVQLIRLWDPAPGKEILKLTGHEGYVIDLAFSPDERFLASASHGYNDGTKLHEDRSVRIWDVAQGMELERISQLYPDHLAFRADGRVLAWLDQGRMYHRDFLIGQDVPDHENENATAFAFSADGWWLAKAQTGGLIRIQEEATGKEVLRFQATPAGVHKLIWAADGRTLISANGDATVLVWDLSPSGWRSREAARTGDQLDLEQAWEDLKSPDAVRAYRAIWVLVSAGDATVNLFERRLRPAVSDAQTERIGRLVGDLDHDDFQRREAASRQLALIGAEATPALVRALINNPSLELRNRAKAILKQISGTPKSASADEFQTARALVVLERLGTRKAEELLKKLAKGAPEAQLTEESKASLQRLARRNAKP
jgi:hypothetical protein